MPPTLELSLVTLHFANDLEMDTTWVSPRAIMALGLAYLKKHNTKIPDRLVKWDLGNRIQKLTPWRLLQENF